MAIPGLTQITEGLELWNRNLGGTAVVGQAIRNPFLRRLVFDGMSPGRLLSPGDAALDAAANAPTPAIATDVAFRDAPWQRFLATSALDPLNLVGLGLPGRLAKNPSLASAKPLLEGLDAMGAWRNARVNQGAEAVGSTAGKLVEPVAQKAVQLGAKFKEQAPGLAGGIDTASRMWKEQILHTAPGYYVRNGLENFLQAANRGDWETAHDMVRGWLNREQGADRLLAQRGIKPEQIDGLIQNPLHDGVNTGLVDHLGNPIITERQSAFKDAAESAPDWLRDPLTKVGDFMERGRDFNTMRIEGAARKAAFATGFRKALAEGESEAGAIKRGLEYANELFFNYTKHTAADELANRTFAFHKFALSNLPYQLKLSAQRPGVLNIPTNFYATSDTYNAQHGRPARFHGSLPIGRGSDGTEISLSPFDLWSVGTLVKEATRTTRDDGVGPVGAAANTLQDLGLGLHPFLNVPLQMTGQMGEQPASGLLRLAQPVNAIGGVLAGRPIDIEGGFKSVTAPNAFPYQEWLIRRRQAELGLKQGMTPTQSLMDPGIRQQAEQDAAAQIAGPSMGSWMGLPLRTRSPEEQVIEENALRARALQSLGLDGLAASNPTAGAYALSDPTMMNPLASKITSGAPLSTQEIALVLSGQAGPQLQAEYLRTRSEALHGRR